MAIWSVRPLLHVSGLPVSNDNTCPPNGNNRYGQKNQPSIDSNNQNHYNNINRDGPVVPNPQWKACGIFKFNRKRLPWLKCQQNPSGPEHPPLISLQGKSPSRICLTGSTCGTVCCHPSCTLIHLVHAREISEGMFTLNKYVKNFKDLDWINATACKIAAGATPGPLNST